MRRLSLVSLLPRLLQNSVLEPECLKPVVRGCRVLELIVYVGNQLSYSNRLGGAMASWLVRSTPERALKVRALAGDIALCSLAKHLTLTVPLSTQECK